MTTESKDFDMEQKLLMQIHEGAKVFDREHKEIGHVDDVFLGAHKQDDVESVESTPAGSYPSGTDTQSITPNFAMGGAVNPTEPKSGAADTVRNRLLREGYIHIETGVLSRDRVALPDQIAKVEERELVLNVTKDQLLKDDILNNLS